MLAALRIDCGTGEAWAEIGRSTCKATVMIQATADGVLDPYGGRGNYEKCQSSGCTLRAQPTKLEGFSGEESSRY